MWKTIGSVLVVLAALVTITVFVTGESGLPQIFSESADGPRDTASRTPSVSEDPLAPRPPEVSLVEVLDTMETEDLTALQKAQFRRRTEGENVRWDVLVREVTPFLGGIVLIFIPPSQADESFPKFLSASFPAAAEADLSSLRAGDKASIKGRLRYSPLGFVYEVSLEDCELIAVAPRQ